MHLHTNTHAHKHIRNESVTVAWLHGFRCLCGTIVLRCLLWSLICLVRANQQLTRCSTPPRWPSQGTSSHPPLSCRPCPGNSCWQRPAASGLCHPLQPRCQEVRSRAAQPQGGGSTGKEKICSGEQTRQKSDQKKCVYMYSYQFQIVTLYLIVRSLNLVLIIFGTRRCGI